ncbi:MAG TPA: MFS transporter, partial [Sphingobacterium sp.]|nr:MFS transporter [Sphingobacterium sp.]
PPVAGFLATNPLNLIFYAKSFAVLCAAVIFFVFFHKREKRSDIKSTKEITAENELPQKKRNPYTDQPFV